VIVYRGQNYQIMNAIWRQLIPWKVKNWRGRTEAPPDAETNDLLFCEQQTIKQLRPGHPG